MFDELESMEDLENELEEEIDEEIEPIEEEIKDEDTYLLIRDVLDQNVETQHLPSAEKFDLMDEDDPRNTLYQVSDDTILHLYDKSTKDYKEISGKEFNEQLMDQYGTNQVEYKSGEPDFSDYVHEITSEEISNYLDEDIEGSFSGTGKLEKTISSIERQGEYGTLEEACELIADELGCTSDQVKDYIQDYNLVIHESNKDEFNLISSDIHNVFRHTGSIGIKKDLNVLRDSIFDSCDSNSLVLESNDELVEAYGLEEAIQELKDCNRQRKRDYYD